MDTRLAESAISSIRTYAKVIEQLDAVLNDEDDTAAIYRVDLNGNVVEPFGIEIDELVEALSLLRAKRVKSIRVLRDALEADYDGDCGKTCSYCDKGPHAERNPCRFCGHGY